MSRADAERLLALPPRAPAADVREAYARRASQLGREREMAITRSLRDRVEQELAALRAARDLLLGSHAESSPHAPAAELPLTSPPDASGGAAPTPPPFSSTGNARVLDRYDLGEKLGSGGMGEVFAAFDRLTSQPVAIKFISERISSRADSLQRFLAEARLSCRLSHPNIVRTFDVHEAAGRYFITMELLEGHTLRQHIASRIAAGRAFERAEIGRMLHQVSAALAYAHKDLVHRDIKPENVWRCADGSIKIMDFGVALDVGAADLAEASAALGTEGYRAPEQCTGADPVDQRADQYSVACIAIELLAAPSPCRPAQQRSDALARRDPVRAVLDRALAGRAADRYPNILDFDAALQSALLRARWRSHLPWIGVAAAIALSAAVAWIGLRPAPAPTADAPAGTLATPAQEPLLQAHARLSEARSLLAALDTLVAQSREDVERLRGELESTRQGPAKDADPATIESREQALQDAEFLAMRTARWALLGDDRVRVEGHVGAALAAIDESQHTAAAKEAQRALDLLRASRTEIVATREELATLRELDARLAQLQLRLQPIGPQAVLALRTELDEARAQLPSGGLAAVQARRERLSAHLEAQVHAADGLLREHWQRSATDALRGGQIGVARQAIAALQALPGGDAPAHELRRELNRREAHARSAAQIREQQELERLELEREQASYRPQRER